MDILSLVGAQWGDGCEGQLGLGDEVRRTEPTRIFTLRGVRIKQVGITV